MEKNILTKGKNARIASHELAKMNTVMKNTALKYIAEEIELNRQLIQNENEKDVENGKRKGLSTAFIDRLALTDSRIDGMIKVLNDVAGLRDPVGEILNMNTMPNGLKVGQMRVPIGVIGIIFESRPNVCIEVASLTIKSGNGVILKGGSAANHSNICLTSLIKKGLIKAGLPESCVDIIGSTSRESVLEMVRMKEYIDVIIPRGGLQLIRFVEENSVIPVIRHDMGICHTFVDEFADLHMAVNICFNAKVQRPGVCNAMETLLVHSAVAPSFLPAMEKEYKKAGVKLKGCARTKKILPGISDATEEDWSTEYLDLVLAVKIVD